MTAIKVTATINRAELELLALSLYRSDYEEWGRTGGNDEQSRGRWWDIGNEVLREKCRGMAIGLMQEGQIGGMNVDFVP